jgi:hypothetical protein
MPYKQYLPTEDMPSIPKGKQPTRPGQLGQASTPGAPRDYSRMIKFKGADGTQYDNPPGDIVSAKGTTAYKKGGKVSKPIGYAKGGLVKPSRGTYSK